MTGVVLDYALSSPPSEKWLMCYGQALLSTDTAAARLRAKLLADGSPYGVDGSGNPRVPDARGRVLAGKDNMGGTAAGRLTNSGTGNPGINGSTLGAAGGGDRHTLTTAQMPEHKHAVSNAASNAAGGSFATPASVATNGLQPDTANAGSGQAHPNVQPTLVLNKIIRL